MSEELEVLSVEDIEAYVNGKNLQDACHIALSKALTYCRLLIGLYRQTDTLAAELKANANAARERAADATRELTEMRQRAEAAERDLAIAKRTIELADENADLRATQLVKRAEVAEAKLALVDTFAQWKRNAPKGSLTFTEWLARRGDVQLSGEISMDELELAQRTVTETMLQLSEMRKRAESAEGRTLDAVQAKVKRLYIERGYTSDLPTLGLGLCEEAGEVAGAINNLNPLYKQRDGRNQDDLRHELKDTLVYLYAIANSAGIQLSDCLPEYFRA